MPGYIHSFGISVVAAAVAIVSNAVVHVTTAAQIEAAVAAATATTQISIDASITATTPGTMLALPAGCTLGESAAYTLSGYYIQCQAAGNYAVTTLGTVAKRLTIVSPNTNSGNTILGTVHLENGKFVVNASIQGANGGGNKNGNLLSCFTSGNNRVEADIYGDYQNSSADIVAIDVGTNPAPATSYLRAWGCKFRSPGSGSADNWFTNHGNCPSYAIGCDFALPGTAGPGINSAPVTSTMEIYGGQVDMTGSAGTVSSDLFLTRIVGVKIVGTSANNIRLVADANKAKPSMALRCQTTVPIIAEGAHTLSPIFAQIELVSSSAYVGCLSSGPNYSGPALWMAQIKGSLSTGSTSVVWFNSNATIYNLTTVHTGVTNSVAVRAATSGAYTANVYRASINSGGSLTLAFASRNDQANTTINLINSKLKASAGGYTNSVAGASFNLTGSVLTDTEPSGALTGWLNESPELAADPTWAKVKAYLATCPALPGDTSLSYPTNADAFV
jgi:hypothetical protein